jgi:hypothetical protein
LAGQTLVYAVRAENPFRMPLEPAISNLTQSIYFIADFVCLREYERWTKGVGNRGIGLRHAKPYFRGA